jgi:hypothetical protein
MAMKVDDTGPEEMGGDARNFRGQPPELQSKEQMYYEGAIGGTHHVSTKLDPERCLTGGYQPLNGDAMPPCPGMPYLPKN